MAWRSQPCALDRAPPRDGWSPRPSRWTPTRWEWWHRGAQQRRPEHGHRVAGGLRLGSTWPCRQLWRPQRAWCAGFGGQPRPQGHVLCRWSLWPGRDGGNLTGQSPTVPRAPARSNPGNHEACKGLVAYWPHPGSMPHQLSELCSLCPAWHLPFMVRPKAERKLVVYASTTHAPSAATPMTPSRNSPGIDSFRICREPTQQCHLHTTCSSKTSPTKPQSPFKPRNGHPTGAHMPKLPISVFSGRKGLSHTSWKFLSVMTHRVLALTRLIPNHIKTCEPGPSSAGGSGAP